MKKTLVLGLIVCFVLGALVLSGCGGNTDTTSTVLKMGTEAGFAPFEYKEGDNYLGIDVEISQKIAEKLGMQLEIADMNFDSLLDALDAGTVDFIAAGMSIKPEREKQADFTVSYFNASQTVVLLNTNDTIQTIADLEGKKIGVQAGTTGNDEASLIKDAKVSAFTAFSEAISALENGTVDAVIMDNFPANSFAAKNSNLKLQEGLFAAEKYAFAIKKDNTELYDKVNGALQELIDDGTVQAIIDKYSASLT